MRASLAKNGLDPPHTIDQSPGTPPRRVARAGRTTGKMSQHRRPSIPFSDAPRGTCRWCGQSILHDTGTKQGEPNLRRRWHPACVDEYNQSDPREARRRVRKRDRGICRTCGLDTNALRREIRGRGRAARLRERGFKARGSLWELDHVVPLIDGGAHDLENLQTLCTPCHKNKTGEEARQRATRRQQKHEAGILEAAETALARSEALLEGLTETAD